MNTRRIACIFAASLLAACSAGGDGGNVGAGGGAGSGGSGGGTGGVGGAGGMGGSTILDASSNSEGSSACADTIDVVFVLDMSSSMGFMVDALSADIANVVAATSQLAQQSQAPAPHFGLVSFVDNHVIDLGGVEESGMVHLDPTTLKNAFTFHVNTFMNPNRNPGDGPSGPTMQNPICEENALDALHAAAEDFPWRANATRIVIVATDDTFLEAPDNYGDRDGDGLMDKTDFPREGDYPAAWTVAQTVEVLKAHQIRVFSFTARSGSAHHCGTGRRLPWEARAAGWSAPYWSNDPIPTSTDGLDYDLDAVRNKQISLAETINGIVLESHCNPPVY